MKFLLELKVVIVGSSFSLLQKSVPKSSKMTRLSYLEQTASLIALTGPDDAFML